MSQSGIYVITNTVNGKVYVGSALNFAQRWRAHRCDLAKNRHHSIMLQRAWNKHGADAFEFSVLESVADTLYLIEREQNWIATLCAFGSNGYNMCPTAGNCLGRKFSAASRAKMSASAMGKEISPETRAKLSASGKAVSPEVRARIAALHVGKRHSSESRAKMAASQRGKTHTAETRAKLSAISSAMPQEHRDKIAASLSGRKLGPRSAETIAKISAAKMGHSVSQETRAKISSAARLAAALRLAA